MTLVLQALVGGIAVGAVYSLIALGYTVIFSTTRVLNFAQGEFLMIGALAGWSLVVAWHLPLWVALPLLILLLAAVGLITERLVMIPVRLSGSSYAWIIATLAVSIVWRNLMGFLYGWEYYRFPPLASGTFRLGPAVADAQQLVIVGAALALMAGNELFMRYSFFGRAVRATAYSHDIAGLMGIPVPWMVRASFMISAVLTGLAGILIAPMIFADAHMGLILGLKGFVAVIVGGMGSARGAILGGMLIGLLDTFVRSIVPSELGNVVVFSILALVLLVRPRGLVGGSLHEH
jgi:branched-chain amino acid transport system permease protein